MVTDSQQWPISSWLGKAFVSGITYPFSFLGAFSLLKENCHKKSSIFTTQPLESKLM